MDLGLYLRVLWRFRVLVAIGILISAGLGILSQARVELDGGIPRLSYRTPLTWASTSTVLITERGFPWGASSLQDIEALQRGARPKGSQYTDPGRFTQLGLLYTRLAKSDNVRAIIARKGGLRDAEYSVTPVYQDGIALPMLSINAWSTSPSAARRLAQVVTEAFRSYIAEQQEANAIPPERRVRLEVMRGAKRAEVIAGRSPVKPLFVLIVGLAATFALAFALENLRPRPPEVAIGVQASPDRFPVVPPERKSA